MNIGSNGTIVKIVSKSPSTIVKIVPAPGSKGDTGMTGASGIVEVNYPITNTGDTHHAILGINQSGIQIAESQVTGLVSDLASKETISGAQSKADTAQANAISTSESYTDTKIATEVINRNSAIATSLATAEGYTDTKISAEVARANAAYDPIGSATTALNSAKSYTDTSVANLVASAPATLDTLNELATALGDDPNFATTVTNQIAGKISSVTAGDSTITIGGTATAPTVKVNTIAESQVTNLVSDLASKVSSVTGTSPISVTGTTTPNVSIASNVLIPTGGTTGQILAKNTATNYDTGWIDNYTSQVQQWAKNGTGSTLYKGQAIYVTGASGANVIIGLAQANAELTSSKTAGLLMQDLAPNAFGWYITDGTLTGIDTSAAGNEGDPIWLSPTTPGGMVYGIVNKPHAPNHMVFLGVVTRKNSQNGSVLVKVQNGFELDELHNVDNYTNTLTNNDILTYESSTSLWKNKSFSTLDLLTGTSAAATYLTQSNAASTYVSLSGLYSNPSWITGLSWTKISSTPTTLAGYGITDALLSTTAASTYEPKITVGITSQYWRGDKTWQTLATVATTGSYNDLLNKPTIPVVPTLVSAFTNDAGYITSATLPYIGSTQTTSASGGATSLSGMSSISGLYAGGLNLNAVGGSVSYLTTNSGQVLITGGSNSNAGASGQAPNGGNITITSGAATGLWGVSGNVKIDAGTFSGANGGAGTVSVGTTNASAVTIGNSASTVSVKGSGIGAGVVKVNSSGVMSAGNIAESDVQNLTTDLAAKSDALAIHKFFGMAAGQVETVPRILGQTEFSMGSGTVVFGFFTPLVTTTVGYVQMQSGGTTGPVSQNTSYCAIGLFSTDETTITPLAITQNDTSLFTATNTAYKRQLYDVATATTPTTVTLQAGQRYAIGVDWAAASSNLTLSSASGTGTIVTYTVSGNNTVVVGQRINVTGFATVTGYNVTSAIVTASTPGTNGTFSISNATTGTPTGTGTMTLTTPKSIYGGLIQQNVGLFGTLTPLVSGAKTSVPTLVNISPITIGGANWTTANYVPWGRFSTT